MKRKAAMMLMMGNRDGYEMESRFRDSRGRPHYNNGRYAPMNYSGMDAGYYPMERYPGNWEIRAGMPRYEEMTPYVESRRRRYFIESDDDPDARKDYVGMTYQEPRRIGFGAREMDGNYRTDATYERRPETDYMVSPRMSGYGSSTQMPRMTQGMAREWVDGMKNADGSHGEHWTMDQTTQVMRQYNINCDPVQFWAVMNSLYSDYSKALSKFNANSVEIYAEMAKAWLQDADSVPEKASAYYMNVVKH